MLSVITDWATPLIVFLLMFVLGMELQVVDFLRAVRRPRTIVIVSVAQLVLLPALAIMLWKLLALNEEVCAAMLILSICPGGAISSYYVYLAGRDVALSVTLTVVSTALTPLSVPALEHLVFPMFWTDLSLPNVDAIKVIGQLVLLVLLPILVGIVVRKYLGSNARHWQSALRPVSLGLLLLLLALSGWTVRGALVADLAAVAMTSVAFTLGAILVGHVTSLAVAPGTRDVVVMEMTVRNVAIALLIGAPLLPAAVLVGFLTGYFIVEALFMVSYAQWCRARS